MASKRFARPDQGRCVACGACIKACPRAAIAVWRGCFAKVDAELCVGCGKCVGVCPTDCIELLERKAAE